MGGARPAQPGWRFRRFRVARLACIVARPRLGDSMLEDTQGQRICLLEPKRFGLWRGHAGQLAHLGVQEALIHEAPLELR